MEIKRLVGFVLAFLRRFIGHQALVRETSTRALGCWMEQDDRYRYYR